MSDRFSKYFLNLFVNDWIITFDVKQQLTNCRATVTAEHRYRGTRLRDTWDDTVLAIAIENALIEVYKQTMLLQPHYQDTNL